MLGVPEAIQSYQIAVRILYTEGFHLKALIDPVSSNASDKKLRFKAKIDSADFFSTILKYFLI